MKAKRIQPLDNSQNQLEIANQKIDASNQQLTASNQQLTASNQQLTASNQQLTASNQQLDAANQQLTASNQQLKKSEEKYRLLFAEMLSGFALHEIICDENGTPCDYRFIDVNPAFEKMTGLKAKKLIGNTVREVMPGIEKHWIETYGKVALTGEPIHFENHTDELSKSFECVAFCPKKGFFAVTFIDITSRKNAQRALTDSEDRYKKLFDNAAEGILVADAKTKIFLYANTAFCDLLGYTKEEVRGMNVTDVHPPESLKNILEEFENQKRGHKMLATNIQCLRKDGSIVYADIKAIPMMLDETLCNVGFFTDVTMRRLAEQQQEQLLQTDKLTSMGTLVAGVAHEINNPNNFITLNAGVLIDVWQSITPILDEYHEKNGEFSMGGLDYSEMREEIQPLLTGIMNGAERIKNIVTDLKNYTRISSTTMSDDVDINYVVQSAITLIKSDVNKATKHFHVKYGKNIPILKGNFQKLEQVVINLLQNACHALIDNQRSIKISTNYIEEAKTINIEITDEGTGITNETMRHIMDPFFTTKRDSGGTGLGLSVSLGIIKDHGGTINFSSKRKEGTTVMVMIPERMPAGEVEKSNSQKSNRDVE